MDEPIDDPNDEGGEESFAAMLEHSLAAPARLEPGQKVQATVLKVGAEWVLLDVGQKGEGYLDVKEVLDADGRPTVKAGDVLPTWFLDGEGGELRFTARIGGGSSGTAQLEEAWKSGIPVEGRLEKEVKGGYEVKLPGNVRAFCPFSLLGLGRQEAPGAAAGRTLLFKITQFGERGQNLVVSHRAIQEEERRVQREALKARLREGMIVEGTIKNICDFGAFVDIGGVEGLIPISEVGWGRTLNIGDVLQSGQSVQVEIKSLDWERDRFSFSLRATMADPWAKVGTVYRQGSTHPGTVARLAQFGAFVTLEEGIDGLLHISKIGEGRRINHPREVLKERQTVRVTIDEIDTPGRRLSLSLASGGAGAEETGDYVNRPAASMGTFGDLLKAGLDKKQR